jgi:hypothetical protein
MFKRSDIASHYEQIKINLLFCTDLNMHHKTSEKKIEERRTR